MNVAALWQKASLRSVSLTWSGSKTWTVNGCLVIGCLRCVTVTLWVPTITGLYLARYSPVSNFSMVQVTLEPSGPVKQSFWHLGIVVIKENCKWFISSLGFHNNLIFEIVDKENFWLLQGAKGKRSNTKGKLVDKVKSL